MDLFGEIDPYIIVEYNGLKFRSKVQDGAGRFAKWKDNEANFEIKVMSLQDTLKISAFDKDHFYDDLLGSTTITIQKAMQARPSSEFIEIYLNDKKSGGIRLTAKLNTNIIFDDEKQSVENLKR